MLAFQYSVYVIPLLIAAVLSLVLASYALRRAEPEEAHTFGLLMAGIAIWTFFLALNVSGANLETQLLFNRLKYLGVVLVPPLWLLLALQYTKQDSIFSQPRYATLLFIPGLISLLIVLTDGWTHWWWPEVWLDDLNGYPFLGRSHGLAYFLSTLVDYGMLFAGFLLYVKFYRQTRALYRTQVILMLIAGGFPLVASIAYHLRLVSLPWGPDAFAFSISGILMSVAIFHYRFLDIVPVARRTVVEQIPEGMLIIDKEGRVVDANPTAYTLLDAPSDALIGRPLLEIPAPLGVRAAFATGMNMGLQAPFTQDVHVTRAQGARVLAVKVTTLSGPHDRPAGRIVLLQDITERVRVQQELETLYEETERARERMALIISTTTDAIVLVGEEGSILAMNPAARKALGTTYYAGFPAALRSWLKQVQEETHRATTEIEINQQMYYITAAPVTGTGLVFTMHDITHFKELARLKDEFVSTVSHDLRSPLTSILGYAMMAQRAGTSEERRLLALERIEASAHRMTQLIEDLLALATLEAGVQPTMESVTLDQLAQEAIEDLEGAALRKGVIIRTQLAPVPPVLANPKMMRQAWHNLLSNAIKYTPAGTIVVTTTTRNQHVEGVVRDTGMGIPAADIPYIFDKFYRVEAVVSADIVGTGLGLALVKSIVEQHGGQVWVESVLGEGSTFGFRLPAVAENLLSS